MRVYLLALLGVVFFANWVFAGEFSQSAAVNFPSRAASLQEIGFNVYAPPDGANLSQPLVDWFYLKFGFGQSASQRTQVSVTQTGATFTAVQTEACPGFRALGRCDLSGQQTLSASGQFGVGAFLHAHLGWPIDETVDVPINLSGVPVFTIGPVDVVLNASSSTASWNTSIPLLGYSRMQPAAPDVQTPRRPLISVGLSFFGGLAEAGIGLDWLVRAWYSVEGLLQAALPGSQTVTLPASGTRAEGAISGSSPDVSLYFRRTVRQKMDFGLAGTVYVKALWGLWDHDWAIATVFIGLPDRAATLGGDSPVTAALPRKTVSVTAQTTSGDPLAQNEYLCVDNTRAEFNKTLPVTVHLLDGCPLSLTAENTLGHTAMFSSWSDGKANGALRTYAEAPSSLVARYELQPGGLGEPVFLGIAASRKRLPAMQLQIPVLRPWVPGLSDPLQGALQISRPEGWYWADFLCDGEIDGKEFVTIRIEDKYGNLVDGMSQYITKLGKYVVNLKQGWPYTLKFVTDGFPQPSLDLFTDRLYIGGGKYMRISPSLAPAPPDATVPEIDASQAVVRWAPNKALAQPLFAYVRMKNAYGQILFRMDAVVSAWPPSIHDETYVIRAGLQAERTVSLDGWTSTLTRSSGPAWISPQAPTFRLPGGSFNGLPPSTDSMSAKLIFTPPGDAEGLYPFVLQASQPASAYPCQSDTGSMNVFVFRPVDVAGPASLTAFVGEEISMAPEVAGTGLVPPAIGTATLSVTQTAGPGSFSSGVWTWTPTASDVGTRTVTFHGANSFTYSSTSLTGSDDLSVQIIVRHKVDYAIALDSGFSTAREGQTQPVTVTVSNMSAAEGADLGYWLEVDAVGAGGSKVVAVANCAGLAPAGAPGGADRRTTTLDVRTPLESELAGVTGFTVKVVTWDERADSNPANNSVSFNVTVSENSPPVISKPPDMFAMTGEPVTMPDCSAADPDGGPLWYRFDYGDGLVEFYDPTDPDAVWPEHTYQAGGVRTVNVSVIDDGGLSASTSFTVTVSGDGLVVHTPDGSSPIERRRPCEVTWTDFYNHGVGEVAIELWPDELVTERLIAEDSYTYAYRCAVSPQLDYFAISDGDKHVIVQDWAGNLVREIQATDIFDLMFADQGAILVICASGGTQVWKIDTGESWSLPGSLCAGAVKGSEDFILMDSRTPKRYRRGTLVQSFDPLPVSYGPVCVQASHEGWLAVAAWDWTMPGGLYLHGIFVYQPTGGSPAWSYIENGGTTNKLLNALSVDWAPDGQRFAVAGTGAVVFGTKTGLEGSYSAPSACRSLRFLDDGNRFAAISANSFVVLALGPSGSLQELLRLPAPIYGFTVEDVLLLSGGLRANWLLKRQTSPRRVSWLMNASPEAVATTPNDGSYLWYPDPAVDKGILMVRRTDIPRIAGATPQLTFVEPPALRVELLPPSATRSPGQTVQFSAIVKDELGRDWTSEGVSWSVVFGGGSIDQNGLFTAPDAPGLSRIQVQSALDGACATADVLIRGAIQITSPQGGEQWKNGDTHEITWTGTDPSDSLRIGLVGVDPLYLAQPTAPIAEFLQINEDAFVCWASGEYFTFHDRSTGELLSDRFQAGDAICASADDERYFAIGDQHGNIKLWDKFTGFFIKSCTAPDSPITAMALDDFGMLLVVSENGQVSLFNFKAPGVDPLDTCVPAEPVRAIAIANEGHYALFGDAEGFGVWEIGVDDPVWGRFKVLHRTQTASPVNVITIGEYPPRYFVGLEDGRVLACPASYDAPQQVVNSYRHGGPVFDLHISWDILLSASADGTFRAWDATGAFGDDSESNTPIFVRELPTAVVRVRWSPYMDYILAIGSDGILRVYSGMLFITDGTPGDGAFAWTLWEDPASYTVFVMDSEHPGLCDFSDGPVRVIPASAPAAVGILPFSLEVAQGSTVRFTATLYDQYWDEMNYTRVLWEAEGGGTIDSEGLFSAEEVGGPYRIRATIEESTGEAWVTVIPRRSSSGGCAPGGGHPIVWGILLVLASVSICRPARR